VTVRLVNQHRAPGPRLFPRVAVALLVVMAASCSSPTPPTPLPEAPVLTCPAAQTVVSPDNTPAVVTYPKLLVAGGTQPVTTACTFDAGARFPVGTTTVSCTATDAQSRTSSCAFTVTVQPALSLKASAILAFGDSITEGKEVTPLDARSMTGVGCPFGTPIAYPAVLNGRFRSLYPTQTITAQNCGWGGEESVEGVTRLPTGLATGSYDVVLLMEGANDLNALRNGSQSTAVNTIANSVVSMIRTARSGRTVFVGTLTPQRPGGKGPRPEWVEPVNTRLRSVVPAEGAVLVDTWLALGGAPDPYISSDGLHPTTAGYEKIADAFLAAIRTTLESKAP